MVLNEYNTRKNRAWEQEIIDQNWVENREKVWILFENRDVFSKAKDAMG